MLMALHRHMLYNSLLKVQQHIATSRKTIISSATGNVLVHTLRRSSSFQQQSSSDSEDETLKKNPYYTTYSKKIKALKNKDPDAYHKLLKHLHHEQQKTNDVDNTEIINSSCTITPTQVKPKRRPSQPLLLKPKTLDQVMNLDLLRDQSWHDISEIWLAYHKTRDYTLSAAIPQAQFNKFYHQSIKYPMFILPLPRKNDGYEFMFLQFQHYQNHSTSNCTVHITPLINYQTYNENAPECLTVEYYTDLCNNEIVKNSCINESCVLMRATYDGKLLSSMEAECLVNQLHIFYRGDSNNIEKERTLKLFNEGNLTFKYSDVIALLESLDI